MKGTAKSRTNSTVEFCFSNYFPGRVNEATYKVMFDIANGRATHKGITILKGRTGTGKTHLLRAMRNEANGQGVMYISSVELHLHAQRALAGGESAFSAFLQKLTDCSLLLIDDIQFAHAGKAFTENVALSIIKQAHPHTHVVIAGDVVLDDFIQKLQEIAPIQHVRLYYPEVEALRQIVRYKAAADGMTEKLNDRLIELVIAEAGCRPYRIGATLNAAKMAGIL